MNFKMLSASLAVVGGLSLGGFAANAQTATPTPAPAVVPGHSGQAAPHTRVRRTPHNRATTQRTDPNAAYAGGGMVGFPVPGSPPPVSGGPGPTPATGGNPGGLGTSGPTPSYAPAGPPPIRTPGVVEQPGAGRGGGN